MWRFGSFEKLIYNYSYLLDFAVLLEDHNYCQREDTPHQAVLEKPSKGLQKERVRTTRLRKKVHNLQKMMSNMTSGAETIKQLIDGASKYIKEPALSFFASQLRNSSKQTKPRGRRWSYTSKVIALSLYHQSPRAYQFCSRIFTLPSVSSLRKWLSHI